MLRFRPRVEEPIFLLTRVTRIFQKIVFTETTRDARAGYRAGLFVARARVRPPGVFLVFAEKTGKYRRSHQGRGPLPAAAGTVLAAV
jgi:hypothetical protein